MALIKSTLLAQISGSLNGTVFSHNAGGQYVRNRSIPTNPGTDRQDVVRTAMTSLSTTWKYALSNLQREQWRLWGATQTVTNRLGDPITLSGIAAFQRVNLFRISTLSLAMILDPPATGGIDPPPSFASVAISAPIGDAVALTVNLANYTAAGYSLAVYQSGPLSLGLRYYRGPYSTRSTVAVAGAAVNVNTPLEADTYGGLASLAFKITLYDTASGLPIWTVYTDASPIPEAA